MAIAPPTQNYCQPSLQGWDIDEHAPFEDFLDELLAMNGLPVDVRLSYGKALESGLKMRTVLEVAELPAEGPGEERLLQLIVEELELVLAEGSFARARVSPGYAAAAFRQVRIEVARVELRWHRHGDR